MHVTRCSTKTQYLSGFFYRKLTTAMVILFFKFDLVLLVRIQFVLHIRRKKYFGQDLNRENSRKLLTTLSIKKIMISLRLSSSVPYSIHLTQSREIYIHIIYKCKQTNKFFRAPNFYSRQSGCHSGLRRCCTGEGVILFIINVLLFFY